MPVAAQYATLQPSRLTTGANVSVAAGGSGTVVVDPLDRSRIQPWYRPATSPAPAGGGAVFVHTTI